MNLIKKPFGEPIMDSVSTGNFTLAILATILSIMVTFLAIELIYILSFMTKTRTTQKILEELGFIIFDYEENWSFILHKAYKYLLQTIETGTEPKSNYYNKMQAQTLKNKSLLVVSEKLREGPLNKKVLVLKNPKNNFPNFKLELLRV